MAAIKTIMINRRTLIRIYKQMKREPDKVFVGSELRPSCISTMVFHDKYMTPLIQLGVVEEVRTTWINCSSRTTKGYRLKC